MDDKTDFEAIRVPVHWAGQSRTLPETGEKVWACGGCLNPAECKAVGKCQRANGADFDTEMRFRSIIDGQ